MIPSFLQLLLVAVLGVQPADDRTVPAKAAVEALLRGAPQDQAHQAMQAWALHAERWRAHAVDWGSATPEKVIQARVVQRQLLAELEAELVRVLQPEPAVRKTWVQAWRRTSGLGELSALMQQPTQDLAVVVEQAEVASREAMQPLLQEYSETIDALFVEWEPASDALLTQAYASDSADERRAARLRIAEFGQRLRVVQQSFASKMSAMLTGSDRDRFVRLTASHPCSHLFQLQPIDVVMEGLDEADGLTGEARLAVDSIHADYALRRDMLRCEVMRLHDSWMSPRQLKQRVEKRDEELACGRVTGEWMKGHPALPVLEQLDRLEQQTMVRLREAMDDDEVDRLPSKSRLLLLAWSIQPAP